MPRDLTFHTDLPHPPAVVWQALTDPQALSAWMMPVRDFAPVVGRRFHLQAPPMPGWDGVIEGEVLQAEPPRLLAYTWRGSRMRTTTTVRWTLTAHGAGTRLRLDHQGFQGFSGAVLAFMHRGGWKKFTTRRLPAYLANRAAETPSRRMR